MMFVLFLRFFAGGVFLVSGAEKLFSPVENFLYVIQAYQLIPLWLARPVSFVFPWVEFLSGLFLMLGLWLRWTLVTVLFMSAGFILFVSQALLRKLPLTNCGCFGDLIHFQPQQVIFLDGVIFISMLLCLSRMSRVSRWSLDNYYSRLHS